MKPTLEHFKQDIVGAANQIALYIKDHSFETFAKDAKAIDAVMMNLIIIGEASGHFPTETREQHPEIRWTSVVGLRNFLVHEYFEIDPKKIWSTATIAVPELRNQIENMKII